MKINEWMFPDDGTSDKQKKRQCVFGAIFAVLMVIVVLIASFKAVICSPSFYLEQNKKYDIVTELELSSTAKYIDAYTIIIENLNGTRNDAAQATMFIDDKTVPMFTATELEHIDAGRSLILWAKIAEAVMIIICVAIIVYTLATAQKVGLRRVGIVSLLVLLVSVALIAVISLLLMNNFDSVIHSLSGLLGQEIKPGTLLFSLMGDRFARDFVDSWAIFIGVLLLIPFAVSFFLARLSVSKLKEDDQDDYLYQ